MLQKNCLNIIYLNHEGETQTVSRIKDSEQQIYLFFVKISISAFYSLFQWFYLTGKSKHTV